MAGREEVLFALSRRHQSPTFLDARHKEPNCSDGQRESLFSPQGTGV